jgi:uncharacterized 2Fe-2S/4Fe-4S cluster protein (DUF4445 family)
VPVHGPRRAVLCRRQVSVLRERQRVRTEEAKVTFEPTGRTVYVLPGTKIIEAAGRAGIILQSPCGGQGTCGKCRVRVMSGAAHADAPAGPHALNDDLRAKGHRLACQTAINGPMVIEIPEESLFEHRQQVLVSDSGARTELNPTVRKVHFSLVPPSHDDDRSDLTRLREAIGPAINVPLDLIQALPGFLRRNDWKGTAVLADGTAIALEPGDTTPQAYGVAFDLGTTTVVGTLFDLHRGVELGVDARLNAQIAHGDDVISRILKVRESPAKLLELQQAAVGTLNAIVASLRASTGVPADRIYAVSVAGNSTMQELLCGCDPSALGEIPFVQAFDDPLVLRADALGLDVLPDAEVFVFPQIGGFVGGDTVAGMVAAQLDRWDVPVLLIDIGTNGEIVVAHNGKMLASSTAAGPAFEGARIRQGMRATAGAIDKVLIAEDVSCNTIGNRPARGLCGTALIDAAAELLRVGAMDETGRILAADEAPASLPRAVRDRLVPIGHETNFLLVPAADTSIREDIYLWQRDARELQLAAGALRAGTCLLLRRAGLRPEDLGAVLLAGAFGNFIRRSSAQRVGLLPRVPCSSVRFIGNAASMGAKLAMLSKDQRAYAMDLKRRTEHVDLSLDPEFQAEFAAAMVFPTADEVPCAS